MQKELGEVTKDTVDVIHCNFTQITHLEGDSNKFEQGLYFYHGNHLSSTQLITNIHGAIQQAILYTPWGNIISEYRAGWMLDTIPSYLFNAKEKDEESGMYYFEARYYSDEDIVFRGRDPLFEKYPNVSPYCYTLNNPVKYIDPDGRRVVISYQEPGQKNAQKLYYHKGELYKDKKYTSAYDGSNSFALGVQSDLNNVASKGGELKNRLNTLVDSKNTHTITVGEKNQITFPDAAKEGAKTGSTTYYNRDANNVSQSRSSLVHELLGHGYSVDQGCMGQGIMPINIGNGNSTFLDQIWAIDIQNVYNKVSGLPLRTTDEVNKVKKDISIFLNLNPVNE